MIRSCASIQNMKLENRLNVKYDWHDLRLDPNDVPFQEKNEKWHVVLDNFGKRCFYDNLINKWRRAETLDIIEPIAWHEIPIFDKR